MTVGCGVFRATFVTVVLKTGRMPRGKRNQINFKYGRQVIHNVREGLYQVCRADNKQCGCVVTCVASFRLLLLKRKNGVFT